jgi:stage III sporulation protein SpoIIIAA
MSVLNLDSAVQVLAHALEHGRRGYVTITGVHRVIESQADAGFTGRS